jgi:hypothetical protein
MKVSQQMKDTVPHGWLPLAKKYGWMEKGCFLLVLKHLRSQIFGSPTKPVLVFVDGHSFHVRYSVVMYCKEQGINNTSNITSPYISWFSNFLWPVQKIS